MGSMSWKLRIGLALFGASAALCAIHYEAFKDAHNLFFYLALDVAFVPVQVLLVTLIIGELMDERDKEGMLRKLNMVIGAFFSEVGHDLIKKVVAGGGEGGELAGGLGVTLKWTSEDYQRAAKFVEGRQFQFQPSPEQWDQLKSFLVARRTFILGLLQNPNLLEHERFTDLLWAVTHLTEELEARSGFSALPETDRRHLIGDLGRAFGLLIREWLAYMQHLKTAYPYIYSLNVRTNPFNPAAEAAVKE
jgi:hypothetical protein